MAFDHEWERIFSQRAWGRYPSEAIIRFIARHFYQVNNRAAIKVLDLGCGGGAHIWYLAKEGFAAYGVDGSVSAIKQTQNLLATESLHADLKVGDITFLDYPDAFFDAVIDSNAIQHNRWDDILTIHSEIARVLKEDAVFFSAMMNTDTTGYNGPEVKIMEKNTYLGVKNAFFSSKVLVHLLTLEELNILTNGYTEIDVEVIRRTQLETKSSIAHYVWSGKKRK